MPSFSLPGFATKEYTASEQSVDIDRERDYPKFCSLCGNPLQAKANFCGTCGASLKP